MRFIAMLIFAVTLVAVGPDATAQETSKGWLGGESWLGLFEQIPRVG